MAVGLLPLNQFNNAIIPAQVVPVFLIQID